MGNKNKDVLPANAKKKKKKKKKIPILYASNSCILGVGRSGYGVARRSHANTAHLTHGGVYVDAVPILFPPF